MAFPAVLAGIGMGASALGGIVGAVGSEYSGQAQANMYNYQAGVARVNATIAQQDAKYALAGGEVQAQQAGMRTGQEIGATRAGFGAGNISGGSASKVIASEIEVGEQNQGIIRANAAKRAYGFQVQGAEDVAQAGAFDVAAQTSKTAGGINAVSSILGGIGSVSSKWLQAGPAFGQPSAPKDDTEALGD
jgi:hypothetical protein